MGVRSVYTTALSTTTGIVAHSWPTALPIVVVHSVRTHKLRVSEPSPPVLQNYDVDTTTTTINNYVCVRKALVPQTSALDACAHVLHE